MNTNAFPGSFPGSFPGFDQFPQGMDFLKQFWAQQSAPSNPLPASASPAFQQAMGQYFLPTFDLEELDKRINDLRTVLQFMEMNTQMVRQSLNALEVQRNTVATLQSMAQSPDAAKASTGSKETNPAAPWLAAWQSMMQMPTTTATTATTTGTAAQPSKPAQSAKSSKASSAVKSAKKPSKKAAVKKAAP